MAKLSLRPTRLPYQAEGSTVGSVDTTLGHLSFTFHIEFGPSAFKGWRGADSEQDLPGPPSLSVLSQGGAPCPGLGNLCHNLL